MRTQEMTREELVRECILLSAGAYGEVHQALDRCRTVCKAQAKQINEFARRLKDATEVIAQLRQIRMQDEGGLTAKLGAKEFCNYACRWWDMGRRTVSGVVRCWHPDFDGETCPTGRWDEDEGNE